MCLSGQIGYHEWINKIEWAFKCNQTLMKSAGAVSLCPADPEFVLF